MTYTPRFTIPEIAESQGQKALTHNEALRLIDALLHPSIIDRDLSDAPASPSDGDMYIVGGSPTSGDDWSGHEGEIAYYKSSAWIFITPAPGMTVWIDDESTYLLYTNESSPWVALYP